MWKEFSAARKVSVSASVGPFATSWILGKARPSFCLPVAFHSFHLKFHPSLAHVISERRGMFKSAEGRVFFYTGDKIICIILNLATYIQLLINHILLAV